jgi:hypothetical protein
MKYIYRISPAIFLLGSSNLFLPAISKIWPAFGHWQPAISSPEINRIERRPLYGPRWLSAVGKKQQRKTRSSPWRKIFAIYVKCGFFGSRNACLIIILQAQSFERSKLCVAMVTMWPKRQQTKIRFWTKNEFIKISFGQSL